LPTASFICKKNNKKYVLMFLDKFIIKTFIPNKERVIVFYQARNIFLCLHFPYCLWNSVIVYSLCDVTVLKSLIKNIIECPTLKKKSYFKHQCKQQCKNLRNKQNNYYCILNIKNESLVTEWWSFTEVHKTIRELLHCSVNHDLFSIFRMQRIITL
jgi:hypothetical protein